MPATGDRAADVLALIEHHTDIGLSPNAEQWDTSERVLYEIGIGALAEEDEPGEPSLDTVAAFERVQAREAG